MLKRSFKLLITFLVLFVFICSCSNKQKHEQNSKELISVKQIKEIAVAPPPFKEEDIFPCSECHDYEEPNPNRRVLEMHEEVDQSFKHDEENRWCLDCHDLVKRDSLRLANGNLLGFNESYKLCGQCHGDKLRDWKVGVHGKRTGEWNGDKEYLLCVHCHDPHAPNFKKVKPEPPPIKQTDIKFKDEAEEENL